ncbi:MAG: hypothetical protein KTR18_04970 [Acidiferrobacterales bacterium]|nr:hypothetical protein [Acidiferrobacterales bacterium]
MSTLAIDTLFHQAAEIDSTLLLKPGESTALQRIQVRPRKYRRDTLFANMSRGVVSLFHDFPAPLQVSCLKDSQTTEAILQQLENTQIDGKIRTRVGKKSRICYLSPEELIRKWRKNQSPINVTDFHIRDTANEKIIDPSALSQFNFLPRMADCAAWIEMMTMVVSTLGGFSDSHSDDCDGSNHCFTGKKLWLAWDTSEGIKSGLEDLDQQKITGRCAFDMETFLALPSSRWFLVEKGQTLFMPGHLTHKVITLERYLGVGSFYIGFPNVLRTLRRWQRQQPNWKRLESKSLCEQIVPEIVQATRKQTSRVRKTSLSNQKKWGLDYAMKSLRLLKTQERMLRHCSGNVYDAETELINSLENTFLSINLPEK